MRQYPRQIKRLIRQYAAQIYEAELSQASRGCDAGAGHLAQPEIYEAELSQALREHEQQFRFWHSGQISAEDLNRRIFDFTHGPARELWQRYQSGLDDMQVAYAITTGLLRRDQLPAELLSHLENLIAFYEREAAAPEAGTKCTCATANIAWPCLDEQPNSVQPLTCGRSSTTMSRRSVCPAL